MQNPYFALTAIFDSPSWLLCHHQKEQIKSRYFDSKQPWRTFSDKGVATKSIRHLLGSYAIHDQKSFDRYFSHYLCYHITLESVHSGLIGCLKQATPFSLNHPIVLRHRNHYQMLYAKLLRDSGSKTNSQLADKEFDHLWQQHCCPHHKEQLTHFLGAYQKLWKNAQLQVNQQGFCVGFSAYHLLHIIQLISLADQVGLLSYSYLRNCMLQVEMLCKALFSDWQLFWSSYLLGLFYTAYQEDHLLYPMSLHRHKELLFDHLYPLIHLTNSPFFLLDTTHSHSFAQLKELLQWYAHSLNIPKLHQSAPSPFQDHEELLLSFLNKSISCYHHQLYGLLKQHHLEYLAHAVHLDSQMPLHRYLASNTYQSAPFWLLAKQYGVLNHNELPLLQGSSALLLTNHGIYLPASWLQMPHFIPWQANIHIQIKHPKAHHYQLLYKGHLLLDLGIGIALCKKKNSPACIKQDLLHLARLVSSYLYQKNRSL
jgi:Protein of unknown function (DUF1266)